MNPGTMHVQDELQQFEAMLTTLIDRDPDSGEFIQFTTTAHAETERIKKAFIRYAFGLNKEKKVERYIQYHQSAIVALIDKLTGVLSPADVEQITLIGQQHDRENLLKILYHHLEDLLAYIERHFAKYFNQHAKSPESYRFMVHREIQQRLPEVRHALEKRHLGKRLLSIALHPLDNFVEAVRSEEVSYKRIIHLRQLLNELLDLSASTLTGQRLDYKVCLTLGYLNFNTQGFFKYCVREITRIVQDQDSLTKQIDKLAYMLKVINQVQSKPGFVFSDAHSSIREQLSAWIAEEISYFEKRQQLSINFPAHADEPVQKDFKLHLNLTVAQLACFLRALKDVGVIKNNNALEVIRFIAGIAQTRNTESISWDSLRTKFYNTDTPAREAVKDLAMAMFNYLRKTG